jgi:hypothetical protein
MRCSVQIDIDHLKANTVYSGCAPSDQHIKHFWTVLTSFSQLERAQFLRFSWGRSQLPAGAKFTEKMRIDSSGNDTTHLPVKYVGGHDFQREGRLLGGMDGEMVPAGGGRTQMLDDAAKEPRGREEGAVYGVRRGTTRRTGSCANSGPRRRTSLAASACVQASRS